MKKIGSIGIELMIIYSIVLLSACNSNGQNSKETVDSLHDVTQTMSENSTRSGDATDFMKQAATVNLMEIQAGQLARQKSSSQRVEDFASMLVNDHTQANGDLKALANSKNMALPDSLNPDHQDKLNNLKKKNPTEFNQAFIDMMVKGHKKAVDLYEDAANQVEDQDVLDYVNKTLPVIKMHLDSAQAIQGDLRGNNNNQR